MKKRWQSQLSLACFTSVFTCEPRSDRYPISSLSTLLKSGLTCMSEISLKDAVKQRKYET